MRKGKGNRRMQNRRKRRRKHLLPIAQPYDFELIDGNLSKYPVGYCRFRKAWLTVGLTELHKCQNCNKYDSGVHL